MSRFQWDQEHNVIRILVRCSNPIINKKGYLDLFVSRCYLKFHLKSPKMFMEFDLAGNIDPQSSLNRTIAKEEGLELVLAKAVPGENWSSLIVSDKTLAKQRREESILEFQKHQEAKQKQSEETKIENDRLSVQEQMRLEDLKRKTLEDKKTEERLKAEKEIYSAQEQSLPGADELFAEKTIPEVRNPVKQEISFSKKKVGHLPARESVEPPQPNSVKPLEGPAHETHPLWLKDKGDNFFKNQDYHSAINAYSQALKYDKEHLPSLMNRSLAYLHLQEFEKALVDLKLAEEVCKDAQAISVILVRKAALLSWTGQIEEGISMYQKALELVPEDTEILSDIESLEKRKLSLQIKNQGDQLLKETKYTEALQKYQESLAVDCTNEVTLSNLGQLHLKMQEHSKAKETLSQALELITHNKPLKVKTLLRMANIEEDSSEAIKLCQKVLQIESKNKEAKKLLSKLKTETNEESAQESKQTGDEFLRKNRPNQALQSYKNALQLSKDTNLRTAVLTNMCACYLMQESYMDVVSTVDRALKMDPKPSLLIRLYWRRAKAYGMLGQVHTAKADLTQALKLDPENPALKKDLHLLSC